MRMAGRRAYVPADTTFNIEPECVRVGEELEFQVVWANLAPDRLLRRASRVAAVWAFGYALYRWYYAAGGGLGMFGTPVSVPQWRLVNAAGGAILVVVALLPLAMLPAWRYNRARSALLALCWLLAVGGVVHALIGITQRVASLSGVYVMELPFWRTIDRRSSDLQALLFNEPWFLIEGLLWVAIAWGGALSASRRQWWWIGSALAATVALTTVGLLSAFGVIGKWIVG